jgi:hypothetical protein
MRLNLGPAAKDLLDAIKMKTTLLFEAIEAEELKPGIISFRTMVATGDDDGKQVQIILEICVDENCFMEDGDIAIVTERPHDPEPYKVVPANNNSAADGDL